MTDATFKGARQHPHKGELIGDLAREAGARLAMVTRNISFRSWPYRASLSGPVPDRILGKPQNLRRGNSAQAQAIMNGRYALPGGVVQAKPTTEPWALVPPNDAWAENLHSFTWLQHFENKQDANTKQHVRWLISTWIRDCGKWNSIAWRPHIIARRLITWITQSQLIIGSGDLVLRSEVMCSIGRQARHLARTAKLAKDGEERLTAAIGLALTGACLSDGESRLEQGMNLLLRELEKQIAGDGGHVSRNPSAHLDTLSNLCVLKDVLLERGFPLPQELDDVISRMGPMLRFFRHGDGRLCLFNGAHEEESGSIDALLARPDTRGRPFGHAPHTGYQRMRAGRSYLVIDTGQPPAPSVSQNAHAGCLSFEMSVGRHRMIVNCGTTAIRGDEWQAASRATAAHSTLTLGDKSSAQFLKRPVISNLLGPRISEGPQIVTNDRSENDQGTWLNTTHDGYLSRFGLIHERRLYLASNGEDLRGEDVLSPPDDEAMTKWLPLTNNQKEPSLIPFTIRFHLHPDVKTSLSQDNSQVLLMLPDGDGWTFRTNGHGLELEDSIYLGSGTDMRRSHQIIVSGLANKEERISVRWALQRVTPETTRPGFARPL